MQMVGVDVSAEPVPSLQWRDPGAMNLLADREPELQQLEDLVLGVRAGRSAMTAVVGEPGIGRSAVLRRTADFAREAGLHVAFARGSLQESELRYGVLLQLVGSVGTVHDCPVRTVLEGMELEGGRSEAVVTDHACRILLQRAQESPLVLVIDDAEWMDPSSRRALETLGRRLSGAVVIVAASGGLGPDVDHGGDVPPPFLRGCEILELKPLGVSGVRAVLESAYDGPVDERFVAAATRLTWGNPAVLHAVLGQFRHDRLAPSADHLGELKVYAAEAAGDRTARVAWGLPDEVVALLRAIAVCDGQLPTDLVCRLAGLRSMPETRAIGMLQKAGLVLAEEPLALAQRATATRILAGMSQRDRQELYATAAELGYRAGLADEQMAGILLSARRMGSQLAVNVLRRAAARSKGVDNEAAVQFLRRALLEPLDEVQRAQVLVELASVEVLVSPEASDARLAETLFKPGSAAVMPLKLRAAELLLARDSVVLAHRLTSVAWEQLDASQRQDSPLLAMHWFADLCQPLGTNRVVGLSPVAPVPVSSTEPAQAAVAGWRLAAGNGDAEGARKLARIAVSPAACEPSLLFPQVLASEALTMTGDVGEAFAALDRVLLDARRQELLVLVARVLRLRASMYLWCGRLSEAAYDMRCLAEEMPTRCWHPLSAPDVTAFEALLHLELDEVERAKQIIETVPRPDMNQTLWPATLLAQGAVRLATGQAEAAVSDLEECGRRMRAMQVHDTTLLPWRRLAALARLSCGDAAGAQRLADEQLTLARSWGVPTALGDALLISGIVADGPRAEGLLTAAVSTLEKTPLESLRAHALAKLAAARGLGAESISLLREAVKIAELNGARRLLRRITEIARDLGVESVVSPLSDAEDWVIRLAGRGEPNHKIADALSVSERTTEELLASAHRKLGVQRWNALSVRNER
jgi:DNA-binding CsgD family transcriptional regulator